MNYEKELEIKYKGDIVFKVIMLLGSLVLVIAATLLSKFSQDLYKEMVLNIMASTIMLILIFNSLKEVIVERVIDKKYKDNVRDLLISKCIGETAEDLFNMLENISKDIDKEVKITQNKQEKQDYKIRLKNNKKIIKKS